MSDEHPPSPCVKVCQLDEAQRFCVACRRTLAEIGGWSRMSNAEKWTLLADLKARQARSAA